MARIRVRLRRTGLSRRAPIALVGRLRSNTSGASAVEFAIIAFPFLLMICATLELAAAYWIQLSLDDALTDAARSIYTGSHQASNAGKQKSQAQLLSELRDKICYVNGNPRPVIFNCNNVRINMTALSSFSESNRTSPVAANQSGASDWNPNYGKYTCGTAGQIMQVEASVDVPQFFDFVSLSQFTLPNGNRVIQAAAVFRVEPYSNAGSCS